MGLSFSLLFILPPQQLVSTLKEAMHSADCNGVTAMQLSIKELDHLHQAIRRDVYFYRLRFDHADTIMHQAVLF